VTERCVGMVRRRGSGRYSHETAEVEGEELERCAFPVVTVREGMGLCATHARALDEAVARGEVRRRTPLTIEPGEYRRARGR
jgi:hypothetical protein